MGVIIAAILLSVIVIVPALTGLFLSGRGAILRVIGAVLVLPLLGVVALISYNTFYGISLGPGNGWTELLYFVESLAVGAIGAIIGGIGRAQAGR